MEQVYLTRRNLLTLLSKLDRAASGDETQCTLIKKDNLHSTYPQSMAAIRVTAVEDEDYYHLDRKPGAVDQRDDPSRRNHG